MGQPIRECILDFSTGTSTNIRKPFDMGLAQYQIMLLRILEPEVKIRPLLFSSDELTLQTRREGFDFEICNGLQKESKTSGWHWWRFKIRGPLG